MSKCNNCGRQVEDGKWCPYCGATLGKLTGNAKKAEQLANESRRLWDDDKKNEAYEASREALQLDEGNALAQSSLANCYYEGIGVEQDYAKAVAICEEYAEQGYARAQYNLGLSYFNGWSVKQDYVKAVQWFTQAASGGDAQAQYELGACYYNGYGVDKDVDKAIELWKNSAELGNEEAEQALQNIDD